MELPYFTHDKLTIGTSSLTVALIRTGDRLDVTDDAVADVGILRQLRQTILLQRVQCRHHPRVISSHLGKQLKCNICIITYVYIYTITFSP